MATKADTKKDETTGAGVSGGADDVQMITLTHDVDGNPFLPDAQPQAVKELWDKGTSHVRNKEAHAKLTKDLKADKEDLKSLYRKYPQFFKPSANDPNVLLYTVGGLTIEIDREETFEVKTFKDAPPTISEAAQSEKKGGKKGDTPADIY